MLDIRFVAQLVGRIAKQVNAHQGAIVLHRDNRAHVEHDSFPLLGTTQEIIGWDRLMVPAHSSGISPIDCKSSRQVSEQLSSPTCSTQPSGRGSPRRTWAYRLHCAQRMVTRGAGSVMVALLLVSVRAAVSYWTARASGAFSSPDESIIPYKASSHAYRPQRCGPPQHKWSETYVMMSASVVSYP